MHCQSIKLPVVSASEVCELLTEASVEQCIHIHRFGQLCAHTQCYSGQKHNSTHTFHM